MKIKLFVISLLLVSVLCSCNSAYSRSVDITVSDGKYYIALNGDNIAKALENFDIDKCEVIPSVLFTTKSPEALKKKLSHADFTDKEKEEMALAFTARGYITDKGYELPALDEMYKAVYKGDYLSKSADWAGGDRCWQTLEYNGRQIIISIASRSCKGYEEFINGLPDNMLTNDQSNKAVGSEYENELGKGFQYVTDNPNGGKNYYYRWHFEKDGNDYYISETYFPESSMVKTAQSEGIEYNPGTSYSFQAVIVTGDGLIVNIYSNMPNAVLQNCGIFDLKIERVN